MALGADRMLTLQTCIHFPIQSARVPFKQKGESLSWKSERFRNARVLQASVPLLEYRKNCIGCSWGAVAQEIHTFPNTNCFSVCSGNDGGGSPSSPSPTPAGGGGDLPMPF